MHKPFQKTFHIIVDELSNIETCNTNNNQYGNSTHQTQLVLRPH